MKTFNEIADNSWIKLYRKSPCIKDDILSTDEEEFTLNAKIPSYDSALPEIRNIEGHDVLTMDEITEYFIDIHTGNVRLYNINGKEAYGWGIDDDTDTPYWASIGSILDWIPVMRDHETRDTVFVNMNKDSEHHSKVLLTAVDNHGREGYFTRPESLSAVLELISNGLPAFEEVKKEYGDSWTTHYNSPIKRLITEMGFEVHYG